MRLQENHGLQNSPGGGGKPYLVSGLIALDAYLYMYYSIVKEMVNIGLAEIYPLKSLAIHKHKGTGLSPE